MTAESCQPKAVPADDEWFYLEVDNGIDPMDVVTTAGLGGEGWEYLGPKLEGKQACRVKLIRLGYVRNLDDAKKKADALGYRLLEGQARKPFKTKYPKPDGNGPVVFGGSGWQDPFGGAFVACVDGDGGAWGSDFGWSSGGWRERCRWAVVSK